MIRFRKLIIYKYCTMGGVERVAINRAILYKKFDLPIVIDLCFLHEDSATLRCIDQSIREFQISKYLRVVSLKQINKRDYDLVSSIDTPEVFDQFDKVLTECHSTYHDNTTYLERLPSNVTKVIVPSDTFKSVILKKYNLKASEVAVLNNFVITPHIKDHHMRRWKKPIVFYYGRLDEHKNTEELFKIFQKCRESDDVYFLILSQNILQNQRLILKHRDLLDSLILKTELNFFEIFKFLSVMRLHNGIFLSASKDESFGFSAAESLSYGIPVVLSNISAHRELCNNNPSFLYEKGNIEDAANKIMNITKRYSVYSKQIEDQQYTDALQTKHIQQVTELYKL